ncbi:hypothetical protein KVR01_007389 [Diaporthe batatas]|uniref:uncharacterized protein n=1 Tax=Diaporthe batatas TaxID=748121 RepID=UPI001D05A379|nr:uncharacterized protein KVR01_007389 [Diaporthe batatas]KAG8162911.1 hypothetical protein KVR01_007389 [Diaporthe batatas]
MSMPAGKNPGGSGYGGSGGGGSREKPPQDPSIPRSGPWQDKPRTESQYEQEQPRPGCLKGSCERKQHEPSGDNYTYAKSR